MTVTEAVAADLQAKLSKAETKVKRLESVLEQARQDRDELATAVRVLVKHGFMDAGDVGLANLGRNVDLNAMQSAVVAHVPTDEGSAMAPKDVTAHLHTTGRKDISGDYVRTTLWRMAQRNILKSANGLYWRPDAPEDENVAASDAETSEAANESMGPVTGRERGYPPSTPEGSIPSGSTHHPSSSYDDLDDDIPF